MAEKPEISVVIASYNDFYNLFLLLSELYKSKHKNFEVVIVDDASKENLSLLKKIFPIRYFRNSKNQGAAITRNAAAKKARGDILISLDSDIKPLSDLPLVVHRYMRKHPQTIAMTGFPGTGAENPSFFARYKYLRDWSYWHIELDRSSFCYFRPAIGVIRRDIFLKLGGYDKRYCRPGVPAVEDLDFSYRLAKEGRILFNPAIVVGHPFGGLTKLLKSYFQRTALFFEILKQKRLFSGVATTRAEAITILLAPFTLLSLITSFFYPPAVFAFSVSLLTFLFRQRQFLRLCHKREGSLFTLGAFLTNWLLYLDIFAGAVYAIPFVLPKEGKKILNSLLKNNGSSE